jgi:hypothetical protein
LGLTCGTLEERGHDRGGIHDAVAKCQQSMRLLREYGNEAHCVSDLFQLSMRN